MIKALIFDLSYTLLFPKNKKYKEELNKLYKELKNTKGFEFAKYFYLDGEIINYLKNLKKDSNLYIFTSGTIQNDPEIKPQLDEIFKNIFSAEEMGISKKDAISYKILSGELGISPSEAVFVDDSKTNVEAAKLAGINAILFVDFKNLQKNLQENLSSN